MSLEALGGLAASALGGGAVGAALTKWIEVRGAAQTRGVDELAAYRKELRDDLMRAETRHETALAELKREFGEQIKLLRTELDETRAELKATKARGAQFERELDRERRLRESFEDRVLLTIRYRPRDAEAWGRLETEIEERRRRERAVDEGTGGASEVPVLAPPVEAVPRRRVLVAEDDKDGREALARILSGAGYDVVAVSSGVAALRELEQSQSAGQGFDALLLDYSMPDLDGEDVVRLCPPQGGAQGGAQGALKIAFYTGHGPDMTSGLTERFGVPVWIKPLPKDELLARVAGLWE